MLYNTIQQELVVITFQTFSPSDNTQLFIVIEVILAVDTGECQITLDLLALLSRHCIFRMVC